MAKTTKELIYNCIHPDNIKNIANIHKDHRVSEHIEELYNLILYQLKEIYSFRSGTIAEKHRESWRHYDDIILGKNKE